MKRCKKVLIIGDVQGREYQNLTNLGKDVYVLDVALQKGIPNLYVQSITEVLEHLLLDTVALEEVSRILRDDGRLILNVKNLTYKKIADDLCEYCSKDWELEKTYHMKLANSEYSRKEGNTYHVEPIFVFKKR